MKTFFSLAVMAMFFMAVAGVMASNQQTVSGDVNDYVQIDVSPTTLDFGSIAFGNSVIQYASDSVVIDTSGSSTASGQVNVDVDVSDKPTGFFSSLLEFNLGTAEIPSWSNVETMGTQVLNAASSETLPARLNGNTAGFGAGPKSAIVTYTITAKV